MKLAFNEQSTIDNWDTLYDQKDFIGECYRKRMEIVLSWIDGSRLSDSSKILDVGCGAGRLVRDTTKRGYRVLGMDNSRGMVIKAYSICNIEGNMNATFVQGNIESLPIKPSSFDFIICLGVVSYLNAEKMALESLAKALKPGGILAISIVNKARLVYWLDIPFVLLNNLKKVMRLIPGLRKNRKDINNTSPIKTYFIPKFQKSLEFAGFRVIEYKTVPWKLLTFSGKEVFPQKFAEKTTLRFEQFSSIPVVSSFGGMCIFKVEKKSLR
jgi:2-polyprenyl-3-methyl-5-hydroxy-6-metoxy-1,4-benzoquinol methylase